jgi:hypothetical protein
MVARLVRAPVTCQTPAPPIEIAAASHSFEPAVSICGKAAANKATRTARQAGLLQPREGSFLLRMATPAWSVLIRRI